jgi:translation elongation factor EF-G
VIDDERLVGEKVSQIRSYSGGKYENIDIAEAGDVVALLGLENTYIGMGIGEEYDEDEMLCQPVLRYDLELPIDVPLRTFIPKLKELLAENPLLNFETTEKSKIEKSKIDNAKADYRVTISVMGEFQLEILKDTIFERYGVKVNFVSAGFVYKETISQPVIGYGHFEPLRHYSEVQILMEPLPRGMGIEIASDLSINDLEINWQKTILSTISEHLPTGVLTGSAYRYKIYPYFW